MTFNIYHDKDVVKESQIVILISHFMEVAFVSIFSGTLSLNRYRVIGAQDSLSLSKLNKKLKTYQAKPLELTQSKELSFGWVAPPIGDLSDLTEGLSWDMSHCQIEDGYLMRIRVEKRKVAHSLLQLIYQKKIASLTDQDEDGKPLSRHRKKELLEETRLELLGQCLPQISYSDLFWNEQRQEVILFSTSKGIQGIFEELFRKTFCEHLGLSLVKIAPPLLGLPTQDWQESTSSETLERMSHTLPLELEGI